MPTIRGLLLAVVVVLANPFLTSGQKTSPPEKFNDAIKRSQKGAETIGHLAELAEQGISKRLIDSTEAIGIFPCHKVDALLEYAVLCPGVISRHLPNGWTPPAFYRLAGGGFGRPDEALGKSGTIILLFMDRQSIESLNKAFKVKDETEARAGQTGPLSDTEFANLTKNSHLVAYAIRKSGLNGVTLNDSFAKSIVLVEDNHINQSLYLLKGSQILTGSEVKAATIPADVFSFQQALQKHFSR